MPSNFKSDDSFLRKLAVGAAGTNRTIERLAALGFNPIELERGSTGFKIWKKIKIKRIRVPDVLCLNTGVRFESRGKTKLEISMSHSLNDPNRAWDVGMRDDDFVTISVFDQMLENPTAVELVSPVHFVKVADMRQTFAEGQVNTTAAKGFEEGSEIRAIWPSALAKAESIVVGVDEATVKLQQIVGGKSQTVKLVRSKGILLIPQVNVGEHVAANQIVASVVPVTTVLTPTVIVDEDSFIGRLTSVNLSERYGAAKALRFRGFNNAKVVLEERLADNDENIYVQLEAAAALASINEESAWEFLESRIRAEPMVVPLETQLETIIVASEIQHERSEALLIEVLEDTERDDELRAGAAWALGQFASSTAATALVNTFNATSREVKTEAARALLQISGQQIPFLVDLLGSASTENRDGLAWVLAKTGGFDPNMLLGDADDNLRRWIAYIVGQGKDRFSDEEIETIRTTDSEVYFAASVLWQILSSWVDTLGEY